MPMRFSTKTALSLSLSVLVGATTAHADSSYQPYYFDRNSVQYSNAPVQVPTNTTTTPSAAYVSAPPDDVFHHFDNEVWVAAGTSEFNFKQTASPIPTSEHGWLPTISAGGGYMTHSHLYVAADGSETLGDVHTNSSSFDVNTGQYDLPTSGSTHETITTADVKLGQGLPLSNSVMLMPYVDTGFRYWNHDSGTYTYHNFDILGGLMLQVAPTDHLMLTAYGSGGTTIGAQLDDPGQSGQELGSSAMEKVGAKIGYDLTQKVELFTTFDYDHFHYGSSTSTGAPYQASSQTEDTTFRVGVGYHFM